MASPVDPAKDRVPSLVYLCQRVAVANVAAISSLGSELTFAAVKPILQRCSADQLMLLEEASPHLKGDTPNIWKVLCFQKFRLIAEERYSLDDEPREPDSWRNRYYVLQEAEMRRFEEVGSKIRSQRMEADTRKREREVRITDRLPPPKRPRTGGWGMPTQPKTLFQKTRTEASKIQKSIYHSRSLPPRQQVGKTIRVHATPDHSVLPPIPNKPIPGRVTVNTIRVPRRQPLPTSPSVCSIRKSAASRPLPASSFDVGSKSTPAIPKRRTPPIESALPKAYSTIPKLSPASSASPLLTGPPMATPPLKSPGRPKKDPMASLFVPKHRAYSQRPHS
ncbi:hypothetical protein FA13DRAFT_1021380 [Coprinellus micaceus]|uniref:Elongin-A n=1 Tax=Coprinellus micaceus TaxID=71717 RepID=A0A4Y7SY75_COPMI|nr:hypothetical protein FA13DRAFT_1021380 [Coprinellus micaceus]